MKMLKSKLLNLKEKEQKDKMDVLKKVPVKEQDAKVRAANFQEVCLGYNKEEAMEEATRCINCKNAQCIKGCPVSINIPGFIEKVKEGKIEEAYQIISESSALPAVCGRVCPQESQCECLCVRGKKGEPVAIGRLERFVADWHRAQQEPKAPSCAEEKGKKVAVVGGGVGCAIAYPVLKKFHDCGAEVHAVVGFKSKDVVILEDKFKAVSSVLKVCTDDGSYGQKGLVTQALQELLDAGNQYDEIFAIGPAIMMKFVSKTTEPYGIPTTVSMSPIMVDGTGMCGGCRLTVGGETKFACVDGPDFDGHKVDWDESLKRGKMYFDWERHKYEETCNLFSKEVQ